MKGRVIYKGEAEGEALVVHSAISFLGDIDPKTGIIVNKELEDYGVTVAKKILIFPGGKGSTVGSYVIYQLKKNNVAPAGIINKETEPIVAVGAIIAEIPLVDKLDEDPINAFKTGDLVRIKSDGEVMKNE
jgi:predicted aconitase with swiveling domain